MTPSELRELAGLNSPSKVEIDRKWADAQINNLSNNVVEDRLNIPLMMSIPEKVKNSPNEHNYENIASRLNNLLNTSSIRIERIN
jgi:hypothetical protein